MKRFHFRLDRLLSLKESEREQRIAALAAAQQRLDDCENLLRAARETYSQLQDAYGALASGSTTPEKLMTAQNSMAVCRDRIAARRADMETASAVVESARAGLREKSREMEILVRLREKKLSEYRRDESREDQKRLDATAVQQFALRARQFTG